eukprot:scaffold1600_cov78-Cyclotella_meneghiniana.AAC.1
MVHVAKKIWQKADNCGRGHCPGVSDVDELKTVGAVNRHAKNPLVETRLLPLLRTKSSGFDVDADNCGRRHCPGVSHSCKGSKTPKLGHTH